MSAQIEKHLEIKTYTHQEIGVRVKIDYEKQTIDLLGHNGGPKQWVFAGRTLEYMQGWHNILAAMEYAIGQAESDLKKHVAAKEKAHARLVAAVIRAEKKRDPIF